MKQCDGQIEMTDYLKSKIKSGMVKDLTAPVCIKDKASSWMPAGLFVTFCNEMIYKTLYIIQADTAYSSGTGGLLYFF